MSVRLPPIGFWSYARQDDESSRGRLSALRSLLQSELQQQYGRDPIQIFQDVSAIPPGAEWEATITAALENTTFFIPIVTPAFIQSRWCCEEFMIFHAREQALRAKYPPLKDHSRIFPITYLSIDAIDEAYDPRVAQILHQRQSLDFRALRLKDYQQEAVGMELAKLAQRINFLLNIRVDPEVEQKPRPKPRKAKPAPVQAVEAAESLAADEQAAELVLDDGPVVPPRKPWDRVLDAALSPDQSARAKAWIHAHGRRAAMVAAAVLVLAVGFNVVRAKGKEAGELKQLSHWGLTQEDWSAGFTSELFNKARLTERLGELRGAADRGEAIAETLYGSALDTGIGVEVDHAAAHDLFLDAARKGEARAQYRLGEQFFTGDGVPAADQKVAFRWYKRAADQGNALGQANVGYYYDAGVAGTKKDPKTAMKWYRRAADQGLASAQNNLANFIENGTAGTRPDREEAARYYRLAADQGYVSAQRRLAYYYYMGWGGLAADKAAAEKLYRTAAEQGSGIAQVNLGLMYANGEGGLLRDDALALYWCRRGQEATFEPAKSDADACVKDLEDRAPPTQAPSPFNSNLFAPSATPFSIPSPSTSSSFSGAPQ